jgi:AraC family transcriptional regulator
MSDSIPSVLANSLEYGWSELNLMLEREARGELAAEEMDFQQKFHFIAIALNPVKASYKTLDGWQQIDYQSGDVIIMPQAELFPQMVIDRDVALIELFLNPQQMMALSPGKELVTTLQTRDPLIEQMGWALYRELQSSGSEGAFYAESMSIALSAHLLQHYSAARLAPAIGTLSAKDIQLVQDYIAANLDAALTIAELSAVVNLSPHHFAELFRKTIGLTPHQYVLKVRIDQAMVLLKNTRQPIVAIAQQVGFQTQSHFTRIFRQHTKVTPKQFRNLV